MLWIWIHPAIYEEIKNLICKIFELSEEPEIEPPPAKRVKTEKKNVNLVKLEPKNIPFERVPKFKGPKVVVNFLKDTLNRFRLIGPQSTTVLKGALQSTCVEGK